MELGQGFPSKVGCIKPLNEYVGIYSLNREVQWNNKMAMADERVVKIGHVNMSSGGGSSKFCKGKIGCCQDISRPRD